MTDSSSRPPHDGEESPLLGSWRNLYLFVLLFLLAEVVLFTLLTRWLN